MNRHERRRSTKGSSSSTGDRRNWLWIIVSAIIVAILILSIAIPIATSR